MIDRPRSKNAFTAAMWSAGADALDQFAADAGVAAVLLTAAGDVFCAGADLTDFRPGEDAGRPFHSFITALDRFPKPLVAAVNGAAVGAGFTMLCYADIVLAAERARFRAPFVGMGLTPEAGSSQLLPARLGWQATARAFFTGGWLGADEARARGFVLEVLPDDVLAGRAHELAQEIAAHPVEALVETKRLLRLTRGPVDDARGRESEVFRRLLAQRPAAGGD